MFLTFNWIPSSFVQIFVGGIDGSSVTEESLRQVFGPYGEIIYVKIPVGKRCAFVQFSSRSSIVS
jgi:RNA recognition motif-containing protein